MSAFCHYITSKTKHNKLKIKHLIKQTNYLLIIFVNYYLFLQSFLHTVQPEALTNTDSKFSNHITSFLLPNNMALNISQHTIDRLHITAFKKAINQCGNSHEYVYARHNWQTYPCFSKKKSTFATNWHYLCLYIIYASTYIK